MSYFSLRKRAPEPEPDLVEEDLDETEVVDEDGVEETPTGSTNPLVVGVLGPGNWIAARCGTGAAWAVHIVAVWAVGFYGGWLAVGLVVVWLLAVGMFVPREHLDRATAWIEERNPGRQGPPEEGPEEAPADPRQALAQWLLDTIGDRPGIHLRELYPAMRKLPGQEGRTDPQLRALLKAFGVPVKRSVRIGRISGRSGVYRHHVKALLPPAGEPPVDPGGDAGQGADSPPLSGVGEGV